MAFLGSVPLDAPDTAPHLISAKLEALAMGFSGGDGALSLAAALLLPAFSMAALTSSLVGTSVSQADEFKALLAIARDSSPNDTKECKVGAAPGALDSEPRLGSGKGSLVEFGLVAGLVFAPPLLGSLCGDEGVFEAALGFGGTFGDLVLFGLVPVAMAAAQRAAPAAAARERELGSLEGGPREGTNELVPGGPLALTAIGAASLALICSYSAGLVSDLAA
eukprot:CAMPEP_0172641084 /NCGR_PEP_ID=MMETSP1068-20121228/225740_1 /TAXON_ID=35684 /ORGANISM="Pseudopedinella elastica, Strain CCMP716" /LENGTH=220 /DNA_ID=CAMNT_0013454587 /DNA_START=26 /DNA_END=688 /DNA_ORIENTATION=-